jgi:hypothetical protein
LIELLLAGNIRIIPVDHKHKHLLNKEGTAVEEEKEGTIIPEVDQMQV